MYWKSLLACLAVLCCSGMGGSGEGTSESEDASDTYAFTKDQLVAFQEISNASMRLGFFWEYLGETPGKGRRIWEKSPDSQAFDDEEWRGKVPVYLAEGHAWRTHDGALEALTEFPGVRVVLLPYCCGITDEGIAHLARLPELRTLVMYRNSGRFAGNMLPQGLADHHETMFPQLLTDRVLEHIVLMRSLETLYIGDNKFSEDAVLKLGHMKTLKYLSLDDSQISDEGMARLTAMLPGCRIVVAIGRRDIEQIAD